MNRPQLALVLGSGGVRSVAAQAAGTRMLHFDLDIDRRIGLWETDAMPRIFDIGCRAAREQLPAIRRMLELPLAA